MSAHLPSLSLSLFLFFSPFFSLSFYAPIPVPLSFTFSLTLSLSGFHLCLSLFLFLFFSLFLLLQDHPISISPLLSAFFPGATRAEILAVTLSGNRVARDVNFTKIAESLDGYTGSDIKEVRAVQYMIVITTLLQR